MREIHADDVLAAIDTAIDQREPAGSPREMLATLSRLLQAPQLCLWLFHGAGCTRAAIRSAAQTSGYSLDEPAAAALMSIRGSSENWHTARGRAAGELHRRRAVTPDGSQ